MKFLIKLMGKNKMKLKAKQRKSKIEEKNYSSEYY